MANSSSSGGAVATASQRVDLLSASASRLPPQPGEWIDRTRTVSFRFEGRDYEGYAGDTLTSALWNCGVRVMGRSFKYHRPRGGYSLCGYDANVIVETGIETNLRGDKLAIYDGLDVRSVNTLGGLTSDRYSITERFSRFLPVGFYYKAFYKPRWLFPTYERMMRSVAGLGKINPQHRGRFRRRIMSFANCWWWAPAQRGCRPPSLRRNRASMCCWWRKRRTWGAVSAGAPADRILCGVN